MHENNIYALIHTDESTVIKFIKILRFSIFVSLLQNFVFVANNFLSTFSFHTLQLFTIVQFVRSIFFIMLSDLDVVKQKQIVFQRYAISLLFPGAGQRGEKLILLHVRSLSYPISYGRYSRVHPRISSTRTLSAPGHDPNLDTVVHEWTTGISLR